MTQITDNLMKKRLQQVTFLRCPTFKLSHNNKGFSSNSSLEVFNSDHQVAGSLEHDGLSCSRMMRHLIELDISSFYYTVSYCINGFIFVSVNELLFFSGILNFLLILTVSAIILQTACCYAVTTRNIGVYTVCFGRDTAAQNLATCHNTPLRKGSMIPVLEFDTQNCSRGILCTKKIGNIMAERRTLRHCFQQK